MDKFYQSKDFDTVSVDTTLNIKKYYKMNYLRKDDFPKADLCRGLEEVGMVAVVFLHFLGANLLLEPSPGG